MPCKSATVPAAVNPVSPRDDTLLIGHCSIAGREGVESWDKSEDLPLHDCPTTCGEMGWQHTGIIGRLFRIGSRNVAARSKGLFCPTLANETEPYDPLFFIRFHILVLPSFGASPPFSTHRAGVNHGIMLCGMYGVRPDRADRYDVARPGGVYLQRRQFHLWECLTVLLRHHQ